ncbi:hypothetical protein B0T21DRAFT_23916 [Apiosordaria backusii]|uniref:Transmembrane protein n=1 Tax=Apiosordaria backusii TaxID=314023 RepID=A0AA40EZR1_9PEZI|nr:hypothetical protein B0T21DRAFT_23916 [Apiosordaria backusii]
MSPRQGTQYPKSSSILQHPAYHTFSTGHNLKNIKDIGINRCKTDMERPSNTSSVPDQLSEALIFSQSHDTALPVCIPGQEPDVTDYGRDRDHVEHFLPTPMTFSSTEVLSTNTEYDAMGTAAGHEDSSNHEDGYQSLDRVRWQHFPDGLDEETSSLLEWGRSPARTVDQRIWRCSGFCERAERFSDAKLQDKENFGLRSLRLRKHSSWVFSIIDWSTIIAGGLAAGAIISFHSSQRQYVHDFWITIANNFAAQLSQYRRDHQWFIERMLRNLQPPNLPVYIAAVLVYSATGLYHLVRGPQQWADFGLVAVIGSVLTGAWLGRDAMLDTLVLGAFLSLLCSKVREEFTPRCSATAVVVKEKWQSPCEIGSL